MRALFMAMILTGAGGMAEAQGSGKPRHAPYVLPPFPLPVPMPVPLPAPPPPPRGAPPQRARADLNTYFSVDDYPVEALRTNSQGETSARLTIGPDGRVAMCTVYVSSGSRALDAATCRILRQRGRYRAARDEAGNPTTGRDTAHITWRLPGR
jgi:protein TonB